ncbi:MAG: nucleotidyl transferase AbiEii/AbiGii toxin family protein [Bacteroidota bacterium]|nr:nucleotidyl transferase AbiEii/AbiGii toxin family protein [Bacteroidota bacterium]
MKVPALKPFSLVGGTALSLRYGHRGSMDLDLFWHQKFDHSPIIIHCNN